MTENNCESPANHLIEELTKERKNRNIIVWAICAALLLLSVGGAAGACAYAYGFLKKTEIKNELAR